MKQGALVVILSIVLITLISFSYALEVGEPSHSIIKSYSPGENLKGWINISLQNEPADSLLTLNEESLSLLEVLENIGASGYTCFPEECKNNYKTSGGVSSKTFSLNVGEEKILGFKVEGNLTGISSLKFNVSVNNIPGCINPLKIDLLDDGDYNWKSRKYSNDISCTYSGGKGCFVDSNTQPAPISEKPYCEKIGLVESGKFKLGAWVKGSDSWYAGKLIMELYSLDGDSLESCNLPQPNITGSEISCEVEYDNPELQKYYVCLRAADEEGITGYETKTEGVEPCGFFAFPGDEIDFFDYYIFSKAAKFDNIGQFSFNNDEWVAQENEGELSGPDNLVDDYVYEKYNYNCGEGCAIPIRFKANSGVSVTISNIGLVYATTGVPKTDNKIYEVEKEAAKIRADFIKLNLDNSGLKVPADYGSHTITLSLGGNDIFTEEILIKKVASIQGVSPRNVAAAVPTFFYASVESNKTIVEYNWSFGAGNEKKTTTENKVEFTYSSIGAFTLTLAVKDEEGNTAEESFQITVSSPKEIANTTIIDYRNRIENIRDNLTEFPSWYKKFAEDSIGIGDLDSALINIEQDYSEAQITSDYISIMNKLVAMRVPKEIKINSGSVVKLVDSEDVDIASLSDLGAGDANEGNNYEEPIARWFNTNIEASLEYKTISLLYDEEYSNNLSVFNLKIKPRKDVRDGYLIFEADLINANWKEEYKQEDVNGKTGIVLSDLKQNEEKDIEFASSYIDPINLVVYLSPKLAEITSTNIKPCNYDRVCDSDEDYKNCRADCKPWGWVALWISIILLGALIAYIILQQWYKRNYETSLFKDRNALFNLVNFINNAKSRGLGEAEIKAKLKQAGWKGEQINYAIKKAKGKFVGMKELKIFEKLFKKKLETN